MGMILVVVVLVLQRHDLAVDEIVDAREQFGDLFGDREVHGVSSGMSFPEDYSAYVG